MGHGACATTLVAMAALDNTFKKLFQKKPKWERLNLHHMDGGNDMVRAFSSAVQKDGVGVRTAVLPKNGISDVGCSFLRTLLARSSHAALAELILDGNEAITHEGVARLTEGLMSNTTLSALSMASCSVQSTGAAHFNALLKQNTSLTALNVRNNSLSTDGADQLAKILSCSGLQDLDVAENGIKDEGLKALATQLPSSQLSRLNLYNNELVNFDPLARALSSCSSLAKLDLGHNSLGDAGAQTIAGALSDRGCKLKELHLVFCGIGPVGAGHLANSLVTNTELQELFLGHNPIEDTGTIHLAEMLEKNRTLNALYLRSVKMTAEGAAALGRAMRRSCLGWLMLPQNSIGDEGVQALCEGLCQNTTVETLNISHQKEPGVVGPAAAVHLAAMLRANSNLKVLNLDRNCLADEGAVTLSAVFHANSSNLVELNIGRNHICGGDGEDGSHDGVTALAGIVQVPHSTLKKLYMDGNKIQIWGADAFAKAVEIGATLHTLSLHTCNVGAHGAEQITGMLKKYQRLCVLNVGCNGLGDRGVKAIAAGLCDVNEPFLQELDMSSNDLTDDSSALLKRALVHLKHLAVLNLDWNEITCKGAKDIGDAVRDMKAIAEIGLMHNWILEDGYKKLKAASWANTKLPKIRLSSPDEAKGLIEAAKLVKQQGQQVPCGFCVSCG